MSDSTIYECVSCKQWMNEGEICYHAGLQYCSCCYGELMEEKAAEAAEEAEAMSELKRADRQDIRSSLR